LFSYDLELWSMTLAFEFDYEIGSS